MTVPEILYRPKHFQVTELVCAQDYAQHGDDVLSLFDPKILQAADLIREHFGAPVWCNDWMKGGKSQLRGLRPADCAIGAKGSMHKVGKALDLTISGIPAEVARAKILANHEIFFPFIRRMEAGVSWLHIDCKNTGTNHIVLFNP